MNLKSILYRAGLKTELIIATTAIIILTTLIGSIFFYSKTKIILFDSVNERGKTICDNLSRSAKYSVLTEDKAALEDLIAGAMWSEDVVYLVITDKDCNVLAKKTTIEMPDNSKLIQKALSTQQFQSLLEKDSSGNPIYFFAYPIIAKKVSLSEIGGVESEIEEDSTVNFRGMVHVALSLHGTINRLHAMLRGIIVITICIIGGAILFCIYFVQFIMKPIEKMAQAASKVSAGDLSQTVNVESNDEIGEFAQKFNLMTAALKNREEELKESYQDLAASEERYRVFIQNSSESIWCFEHKNRKGYVNSGDIGETLNQILNESIVVECNDAMAKMYGLNRHEEALNQSLNCFMALDDPQTTEHFRCFLENKYSLNNVEKEFNFNEEKIITLNTFLGTVQSDKLTRVWVIQRDITEIKRAEQIQMQLFSKVQEANQELKEFAYVASHDLKAPLRGIKTLAEWLSKDYADKLDDAGRLNLKLLSTRVDRMHNLIDGILQYSRVGRIHENPTSINLNDMIPEIIDMLAPPSHIEIKIEQELPTIVFEETRVRQVFQNLLSNAIKYMDKPKGIITVGFIDQPDSWKFNVTDNGPGIEEKYFEKIFKIFQTLTPRDEYESTGIGLTLVKKIVELYGGKIWVESTIGKGTTFNFTVMKKQGCQLEFEKMQSGSNSL